MGTLMATLTCVNEGQDGYCLKVTGFGFFSGTQIKIDTNDWPYFGDPSGYTTFKIVHFLCDFKVDVGVGDTCSVGIVHGSVIHQETGLAGDTWHHINWDEATINHAGGINVNSWIIAVALAGSGNYPNVPAAAWLDNVYLRFRLS